MIRNRVFPGGPHTGTPITAASINRLDSNLSSIVDWVTADSEQIGGVKTFASTATSDIVVDSTLTCEKTLTQTTTGDSFSQEGAIINHVRADYWGLKTQIESKTFVFPATDCVTSVFGPVANPCIIAFDGRNIGWQMTFLGSYLANLNSERYLCLPQIIPIGSSLKEVRVYYTGQITSTFQAGSRPLQAQFNRAQNGRPKYGGDFRVLSEPINQIGDGVIIMNPVGQLLASDRLIIGLKILVSATWSCIFTKLEVDVEDVTRHAFDRGWV
jgi:hypothetical protein